MKLKTLIKAALIAGTLGIALTAAGCGGNKGDAAKAGASGNGGKKIVKVAHTPHYFPYDFVDDDNKSDGMEVAVMKEVAKNFRSMNSGSYRPLMTTFLSAWNQASTTSVPKAPGRHRPGKRNIFSRRITLPPVSLA